VIDLLYVAFNRLEMTRESFAALVANTDWSQVARLFVHDDGSTDGTREYLEEAVRVIESDVILHTERLGGPVAAMNWYLDHADETSEVDTFAKIDNDFVVCPRWLDLLLHLHFLNPGIDLYGTEPMMKHPRSVDGSLSDWSLTSARHIGGKGLIRYRAFERSGCRPYPHGKHGYQGFTQWQLKHRAVKKAWVTPDIPCFGLDQLPFEPWQSLTDRYVEFGWQRRWGEYDPLDTTYWNWWIHERIEETA